jgi:hypothetical protein
LSYDVKTQRGVANFGATEDALDVTVTSVGNVEDAFARLNNTVNASSGRSTADTVNINADDVSMGCIMDAVDNIALTRVSTGDNVDYRANWELWEYIGDPGGPNEFIVREQRLQLLSATVATVTRDISALTNAVSDFSKLVPVLLGFRDEATGATWDQKPTIRVNVGGEELIFERTTTTNRVACEYALIEFTGSNWQVEQNVSHTYTAAGTDETETISTITDWATAFIFATHHTDQNGLDETGYTVRPGSSTTTVRFRMRSGATIATDERTIAFVVRNPDVVVEHLDSITGSEADLASGNTTQSWTATTVDSLTASAVIGYADCAGTGTAYPRQFWGLNLGASVVEWRRGRSGQVSDAAAQVIQFPQRVVDTDPTVQASTATVANDVDVIRQTDPTVQASTAVTVFDVVRISVETTSFAPQAATGTVALDVDPIKQAAQFGVNFNRQGSGQIQDGTPSTDWDINTAAGHTFEIWFRVDVLEFGTANFARLFGRWTTLLSPNKKYKLDVDEDGDLTWFVSASTDRNRRLSNVIEAGITYQAICEIDFPSNQIRLTLSSLEGGWKIASGTTTGSITAVAGGTALRLGSDPNIAGAEFDGMMCRLRKWDALFTVGELETLFNNGEGRMFEDLPPAFSQAGGDIAGAFELDEYSDGTTEVRRFDRLAPDTQSASLRDTNTMPSRSGMGFSVFPSIPLVVEDSDKIVQFGQAAVQFVGGDDNAISTPARTALDLDNAAGHTFECWFFMDAHLSAVSGSYLFSRWSLLPGQERYNLAITSGGKMAWTIVDDGSVVRTVNWSGTFVPGVWYQVITSVDYPNNTVSIRVSSGCELGDVDRSTAGSYTFLSGGPSLSWGRNPNLVDSSIPGAICRWRKWSGVLDSDSDAAYLFNDGMGRMYDDLAGNFSVASTNQEAAFEMLEQSTAARRDFVNGLLTTDGRGFRGGVGGAMCASRALAATSNDRIITTRQHAPDFTGTGNGLATSGTAGGWHLFNDGAYEVWVKIDGTSDATIIGRWDTASVANSEFRLRISSGDLVWDYEDGGSAASLTIGTLGTDTSGATLPIVGVWAQIVLLWDMPGFEVVAIVSWGGMPRARIVTATPAGTMTANTSTKDFVVGNDPDYGGGFTGQIQMVRIFGGIFDSLGSGFSEIDSLYDCGRGVWQPGEMDSPWVNVMNRQVECGEFSDGTEITLRRAINLTNTRIPADDFTDAGQLTASTGGTGCVACAETATTAIPATRIIQTAVAVQASTATVVIDADSLTQTAVAVQASTALVVIDADKISQTSPTVQAETATTVFDAQVRMAVSMSPQAETATTAFDVDKISQTSPTVQAATATVSISADELTQTAVAVQASTALVADDVDKISQTAPTVQASTATTAIDGTVTAGGVLVTGDVVAQASTALAVTSVDEIKQTSPTVQAATATVTTDADHIPQTSPTVQASTALVVIDVDKISQTSPTVQAVTATVAIDAEPLLTASPTVQASTALVVTDADKISQTAPTVQASTATTVFDAQLRMATALAVQASTALAVTDVDKISQTAPTVQASTATVSIDADWLTDTTVTAQASTALAFHRRRLAHRHDGYGSGQYRSRGH